MKTERAAPSVTYVHMCDGGTAMSTALEDEIISPTNFVLVTSHECSYTFKDLSLSPSLSGYVVGPFFPFLQVVGLRSPFSSLGFRYCTQFSGVILCWRQLGYLCGFLTLSNSHWPSLIAVSNNNKVTAPIHVGGPITVKCTCCGSFHGNRCCYLSCSRFFTWDVL